MVSRTGIMMMGAVLAKWLGITSSAFNALINLSENRAKKPRVELLAAVSAWSITIRDMELAELFFQYVSALRQIRDLHEQAKLTEAKMEERLGKAQTAAQKVGGRAETLLAML